MINSELKYFSKIWIERFRDHHSDSIESALDAFFGMYILFDTLKKEVTKEHMLDKKISTGHSDDRMLAIKNICKCIGHAKLAKRLIRLSEHDIYELIDFCRNDKLYCKSTSIINIEKYLLSKKKKDAKRFNKAILSLIYERKERLFEKEIILEDEKQYLLITMSSILHTIIMALIKEPAPKIQYEITIYEDGDDELNFKIDK